MEKNSSERKKMKMKMKKMKKKKIKRGKRKEDRINDLPEPILQHILSFLDTKSVIETNLVSKRWRDLWRSIPYLNFDYISWRKETQDRELIRERNSYGDSFINFVDKVLLLRDNSNLSTFRLSSGCGCVTKRIEIWVIAAVKQHVEEVHLEIVGGARISIKLPSILFTSTVREFKLQCRHKGFYVQFPNSLNSAVHLKTLELESVKFPEGDSNGEFLLACPVLENLIIRCCDYYHLKVFNISAFRLQNLVLESYKRYAIYFKICTPNLKSLQMKGKNFEDCYLENLSSLVSAHVDMNSQRSLIKFLNDLYNATTLTICNRYSWYEYAITLDRSEWRPKPFHNLRHLRMCNWYHSSFIGAMMNLLESSPYLETLALEMDKFEAFSKNDGGDLGAQLTSHCMLDHLKSVEIHNLKGCQNELKFLEFVLKNAVVLKNFTITTCKTLTKHHHKVMKDISKKLQLLPVASSNVTYYFS